MGHPSAARNEVVMLPWSGKSCGLGYITKTYKDLSGTCWGHMRYNLERGQTRYEVNLCNLSEVN